MPRIPSPRHQTDILREPDRKPVDFRATSQRQSNAGTYDDRGGNRLKKILLWIGVIALVAVVATIIVDVVAGRAIL